MKFKCAAPTPAQARRFSVLQAAIIPPPAQLLPEQKPDNTSGVADGAVAHLSLRRAWLRGRGLPIPPPTLASPPRNLRESVNTHRRPFKRPAGSIGANVPLQMSARSAGRGGQ